MSNSHYTNSRSILHTYSHAPYIEGQEFIDQATARAGHYVNQSEVRADKIPVLLSIEDRDRYLIEERGIKVVGGELGGEYVNTIKFLDKYPVRLMPGTNGEAYEVVDEQGNVYKNFICPTDAQDSTVVPSLGYEIRLFSENDELISRNYGWEFDTFNGILHFSTRFNPSSPNWTFGQPRIQAFVYIGKYTTDKFVETAEAISQTRKFAGDLFDSAIVIQPYRFNTADMTKEGEPYIGNYIGFRKTVPEYYQRFSIKVAGYCFELSLINENETIMTEMRHLSNGDTQIFIDLPWSIAQQKAILYYLTDESIEGIGNRIPQLENETEKYTFLASTFIRNDGQKIATKPVIDYSEQEYLEADEGRGRGRSLGWAPPPDGNLGDNVNINLNF